ncbi:hypothetical protein EOPP23_06850 [Endozoicomonas sp. OPT23]|uniref:DUF2357 domain-containing protein n=1 Tax=Endozoicomonas sp. OPT23 TaxID=2072845 RepID=UPI00129BCB72|nr:DUF2357 domain-containing protein [Endozoicomonas sp. OPT23]MRI32704.1 hypothetical protein [Endozoicomonas sp. OPT23]
MPELLSLSTRHWNLSVWSRDISQPRRTQQRVLTARGKSVPVSVIKLDAGHVSNLETLDGQCLTKSDKAQTTAETQPLFFENRLYEFDFQFNDVASLDSEPRIAHPLSSIEEAFHFRKGCLRGSINFGNNVGWFRLVLRCRINDVDFEHSLAFQVFPTKLDMATDIACIQQQIDEQYPLWRFSLAQKTESDASETRKQHERFSLLWLAQFQSLRQELMAGVKLIINSPHGRLTTVTKAINLNQFKGRVVPSQEEKLGEILRSGSAQRKIKTSKKLMTVDTPENRFIKMILKESAKQLRRILHLAKESNSVYGQERLSESFFKSLEEWVQPIEAQLRHPFLKEVGEYEGMTKSSLVLQQKAGYSKVYRVWQKLKLYLAAFGQQSTVSVRTIAELYEVWCVLEIRRQLLEIGFKEKVVRKAQMSAKGLEKQLKDGLGAAFEFENSKGVNLRLAHEPVFSRPYTEKEGGIYSWTTVQKPDILLEATFTGGERFQWIFDAKYRLNSKVDDRDLAPEDAINQMHRYRDALIQIESVGEKWRDKQRPIVGAYVLYPGNFDEQEESSPYQSAINEVSIGAFPLLPGKPNSWLKSFLESRLVSDHKSMDDYNYLRPAIRIAPGGMELSRYSDLTLLATAGPDRNESYIESFQAGDAGWYHMPLSTTNRFNISRAIMKELRFFGLVLPDRSTESVVEYIYRVDSIELKKRSELSIEQTGLESTSARYYWLLKLSRPYSLNRPVRLEGVKRFAFKLTNEKALSVTISWEELPSRYEFLTEF